MMNEDNKIFKTNEFSIEVSPVENTTQAKNVQYFSYDENSGLQLIHILMDGKPLDLPNGTEIRLSAVKLNNKNQKLIYTPEIVDPLKGIVSFVIPREFLGYQGQIRCGLYINFSNNQTMHVGYFYINMGVSDIDTNLTEFTEDFWQGWSEFEAGSTAKMQELEQRIDEQTEIFNNADVYNKTEIEDKLEPFALRTDIDTLEINKADKTDVNQLATDKADKTSLAQTTQRVDGLANGKVDKGGASQVTMGMLTQEVKTAMTGGSVAVVGKDAVSTVNIVDRSVADTKVAAPILKATLIISGTPPNYDRAKKTFKFNGVDGVQDILIWGNGTATNQYLIPAGLEIVNQITGTTAFKLAFDVTSKTFSWKSWVTPLTTNEILVTSFRIGTANKHIFISDFPIYVDGFPNEDILLKMPTIQILGGGTLGNNLPKISTKENILEFPGGYDWLGFVEGKYYTNFIPKSGLKFDLTQLNSSTSAHLLVFNLATNEIVPIVWNDVPKYAAGYALVATIRKLGKSYNINMPFPFLVDGKLFGYNNEIVTSISVSLDAPVKCVHHRGYSLKYPENTLLAYRKSKTIGVNEVEMDLSWTADMAPVNLHDGTINRTARDSDGNPPSTDMKISEITLAQAREYEYGSWKGAEFKGEKLPTFEDCVIQCKALNQRLHVDRAFLLTEDKLEILDTILTKYDFYNIVWYINSKTSGDLIRAKYPNATLAYLLFSDVTQGAIDVCKQLDLEAAKCIVFPQADLITEVNVDLALSENIEVHVWNADNLNRYTLISMGVSGISTDFANIQEELL